MLPVDTQEPTVTKIEVNLACRLPYPEQPRLFMILNALQDEREAKLFQRTYE